MRRTSLPCLALLLLIACSPETAMNQELASAESDVAQGGRGLAKLNPSPRKAYELVLRLHNPPGSFAVVEGVAQYDVSNEAQCGYIEPATGAPARITSQEPVTLRRVTDNEYRGTVYLDRMLDEDYYGRGVCHWAFSGAGAMLKATGADGETRFLSFIEADPFVKGQSETRHYPQGDYPRVADLPDYGATGQKDASRFRPELQDTLFSATLTADEVQP
ncbi:hypothetical protein WH218_04540 [Stenotrophomonas indicatrix]|uniref:Lipoprotein n=2 Tax=Stenotrophomonas indicatrix TaxID=2045451 RepID=A0ABT8QFZ3_9GAMM|nr:MULTISPECIES: hypothetical protein [Stenotrophomonas]MBA0098325.1 hypothetical protein [Stenotrophomonas indicatrix]MDN8663668.1 hypothetical protein [Stenotrophomonas indicatrix]MDN8669555.1 hypothetical protein [Stenotrophomonas indicatrix]PII12167.1 hypothetical protein CR918_10810 [Stenotrophomonas indicatrix]PII16257.1 hypothetical protein CR920_10845 [Stenotrophomonas indicatrix]